MSSKQAFACASALPVEIEVSWRVPSVDISEFCPFLRIVPLHMLTSLHFSSFRTGLLSSDKSSLFYTSNLDLKAAEELVKNTDDIFPQGDFKRQRTT